MASSPTETTSPMVAEDFKALRDDIARLNASVAQLMRQKTEAAADHVRGVMDDATDEMASSAIDMKARVQAASSDLEATITRNPVSAILLSMVAGLLLGHWSRRN